MPFAGSLASLYLLIAQSATATATEGIHEGTQRHTKRFASSCREAFAFFGAYPISRSGFVYPLEEKAQFVPVGSILGGLYYFRRIATQKTFADVV